MTDADRTRAIATLYALIGYLSGPDCPVPMPTSLQMYAHDIPIADLEEIAKLTGQPITYLMRTRTDTVRVPLLQDFGTLEITYNLFSEHGKGAHS
jgi:hypothetical protein